MLKKLIILGFLFLILLSGCAVTVAVLRPTADSAITQIVEHEYAADPLDDAIQVYTTIRGGNGRGWMVFALFMVFLVFAGSYLAFLKLKPEYLKRQTSLLREMRRGKQTPSQPRSWVVPQSPALPNVPRVDETPMLTDGTDSDTWIR